MKLPADRLSLAVALICALASVAHAQEPAPAQKPPQEPVERVRPWSFSLGVHEVYESDVQFTGATGNGGWSTRFGGQLGHVWTLRRGSVDLSGDASQIMYQGNSSLDRFTYGAGLRVAYALTRRLSWRLGEVLSSSYAQDSAILTEAGLLFPRVETRTNSASTDLTYSLSPRSQITGGISATTVLFDGSEFTDGSTIAGQAGYTRQIKETQSVGVSFSSAYSDGNTGNVLGVLGTWEGRFGRGLTLNAAGGVRPYQLDGVSGYRFAPGVSLGLGQRVARSHAFGVSFEHTVEQAYGYDRTTIADRINASYEFTIGRRLSFDGGANYGWSTDPRVPGYRLDGQTATVAMHYLLGRGLSIGVDYGIWAREETGVPSSTDYRTTASLSYGTSRRPSSRVGSPGPSDPSRESRDR